MLFYVNFSTISDRHVRLTQYMSIVLIKKVIDEISSRLPSASPAILFAQETDAKYFLNRLNSIIEVVFYSR